MKVVKIMLVCACAALAASFTSIDAQTPRSARAGSKSKASVQRSEALRNTMEAWLKKPQIRAFLDVVSKAEGTYSAPHKGYATLYGGGIFSGYTKHPNTIICARLKGRKICSTASGKYQFLHRTWNKVAKVLGLKSFSPKNQDLAAVYLLYEKKVLHQIVQGNVESAITRMNTIWASFPGAPFDQPVKKMGNLKNFFNDRLAYYTSPENQNNNVENVV